MEKTVERRVIEIIVEQLGVSEEEATWKLLLLMIWERTLWTWSN